MGDAVGCAMAGQVLPNGYYHLDWMLGSALHRGVQVGLCGTCMDARAIDENEIVEGARRSSLEELTDWTLWADHTVLSEPTGHQAEVLAALCRQAERVTVMTETARRLLVESETCAADKVRVVAHGAPTVLARRASEYEPRSDEVAPPFRQPATEELERRAGRSASPSLM